MTPHISTLANFMTARHDIYLKRAAGLPGPWTNDPVLLTGRFCNVYRELDRVTIWIRKNIREPFADHPHLWFMLAIARYINWPPTLEMLINTSKEGPAAWPDNAGFDLGPRYIATHPAGLDASTLTWALSTWAKQGEKTYTGAYMIRAESDPKVPWYSWSKHKYIAEIVLGRLWEDREKWSILLENATTLEEVWTQFQHPRYVGWGPFMAYEVVTDLRHTRYLSGATDIYTWANAGPGAIRGLNRLYNRKLKSPQNPEQTRQEIFRLMLELNDYDKPEFNRVFGLPCDVNPRFEMRDIEHSLCEMDKHQRVTLNEGRMRTHYNWKKAEPLT